MRKLFIASLFALSCTAALADLPEGYEFAEQASNEATKTFVNKTTGAMVSVTVSENAMPANAAANEVAKQFGCTDKVVGDENLAKVVDCSTNDAVLNMILQTKDGKTVMIMYNDKATEQELDTLFGD